MEEYLDAPGQEWAFAVISEEGFRLVNAGDKVESLSTLIGTYRYYESIYIHKEGPCLDCPGCSSVATSIRPKVTVLPYSLRNLGYERALKEVEGKGIKLLYPVGKRVDVRADLFEADVPLFQKFANLANEEEILAFAGQYGSLFGQVKVEYFDPPCKGGAVYLESVSDWYDEIKLVKTALKLMEIYENRSWATDVEITSYGRITSDYVIVGNEDFPPIDGPTFLEERVTEEAFKHLIVVFFNKNLHRFQSCVHYDIGGDGKFCSMLFPTSLAGAIWLHLAQSFFGDAPNERMAKRCYICGQYGNKMAMRKRREGEYSGRYYHINCYRMFTQRKYRERKAKKEERTFYERGRKQTAVNSV